MSTGRANRAACALLVLALALHAGTAWASPAAKLTYLRGAGAERCPDEAALRKAVAARLGFDVFFPWAKRTVVAEITRGPHAYRARLQIVGEDGLVLGTRAIDATSDDCGDVVRALALAISIAVDDFGLDDVPPPPLASPPPPPPPPPAPVVAEPSPAPPTAPPAPSEAAPARPPHGPVHAAVGALYSFGIAQHSSFGLTGGVDLELPPFTLGVEVRGDLPAPSDTAPSGGAAETYVVAGSLVPCVRTRFPLYGCAVVSLGDFHETGVGLTNPTSGDAFFAAIGPRLGGVVPLGPRVSFYASADALFVLVRHPVTINDAPVFTQSPVAVTLAIGTRVRF